MDDKHCIVCSTIGSVLLTINLVKTYLTSRNIQVFNSQRGIHSHYKLSLDHRFCFECEEYFDGENELWDHIVEDHHACRGCHQVGCIYIPFAVRR